MTNSEVWANVPGFPEYQVSSLGRVVSYKRRSPRFLRPRISDQGYLRVSLLRRGVTTEFKLHRLVALCFLPNPKGKREVNHRDGDKSNCRVDNLEWATRKENDDHSRIVLGMGIQKTAVVMTSVSGESFRFNGQGEAARAFGIRQGDLNRVLRGRRKSVGGFTARYA